MCTLSSISGVGLSSRIIWKSRCTGEKYVSFLSLLDGLKDSVSTLMETFSDYIKTPLSWLINSSVEGAREESVQR